MKTVKLVLMLFLLSLTISSCGTDDNKIKLVEMMDDNTVVQKDSIEFRSLTKK